MEPLTRQTLKGTWAPILLPIRADESIDWDILEDELDLLLEAGLDGIYTNGTSGEFWALTDDEDIRLATMLADRCHQRGLPFQLGASHMSALISLGRISRSIELAPSAFQVTLPDWLPLSAPEVIDVVTRFAAEAQGIPIVLYNPPHAKTQVSPQLLGQLVREEPLLIGVKVAGGDGLWFADMMSNVADLSVFVAGHTLASGISQGAAGSYSNVACLNPLGSVRWYRQMLSDPASALDVERRLNDFFAEYIQPLVVAGYSNPALDKALAAVGSWTAVGTRTRWPHRGVPANDIPALRDAALAAVPELLIQQVGS